MRIIAEEFEDFVNCEFPEIDDIELLELDSSISGYFSSSERFDKEQKQILAKCLPILKNKIQVLDAEPAEYFTKLLILGDLLLQK
jgi:hypothetical protein